MFQPTVVLAATMPFPGLSSVDLRIFQTIVEAGGISAAARLLGREKSTVSRDLAALEARLGTRLLQRTTRHVSPTEAGTTLLGHARRVAEEIEAAEAAVQGLSEGPRGLLRVTAPYAIIRFALAPRLPAFQARHPHLRLAFDPTMQVLDLVQDGVDLAIRIGALPPSSLVARRLADARVILVAAPDYLARHGAPAAPADLAGHRLAHLGPEPEPGCWTLVSAAGGSTTVAVTPGIAVGDPGVLIDMAMAGVGITPVPDLYAAEPLRQGRLVRVLPGFEAGQRPIHAVYPSRRHLAPKVGAFIDFAAEAMRDLTAWSAGSD